MMDCKKIEDAATRELEGTDQFVVSCTCAPGNEVMLLIDSDTSVSIESCVALSRAIEDQFDREVEDFELTVASAGIGSELVSLRQYRKLVGSSVEVLLLNGLKILARLEAVTEQGITLSYEEKQMVEGKKKKIAVTVTRDYLFSEIKSTKEYLDFK
ncbi:MAG: ribosome assembly cofactor RimP [Alistipes sp.]